MPECFVSVDHSTVYEYLQKGRSLQQELEVCHISRCPDRWTREFFGQFSHIRRPVSHWLMSLFCLSHGFRHNHADGSRCVGRVISCICDYVSVCLCVRALKGKRLELSTPNLVDMLGMAVALYALTFLVKRSKKVEVKVTGLSDALPAWVCMSTGLLWFSSYYWQYFQTYFNDVESLIFVHLVCKCSYLPMLCHCWVSDSKSIAL